MKFTWNTPHTYVTLSLFADSTVFKTIDGAHLDCVVRRHPALASMMHLLPENIFVSRDDNIPGLTASPTGKVHITGKMLPKNQQHIIILCGIYGWIRECIFIYLLSANLTTDWWIIGNRKWNRKCVICQNSEQNAVAITRQARWTDFQPQQAINSPNFSK